MSLWTASEKEVHDKVFNIVKNAKHDGLQRVISSVVYKFFD